MADIFIRMLLTNIDRILCIFNPLLGVYWKQGWSLQTYINLLLWILCFIQARMLCGHGDLELQQICSVALPCFVIIRIIHAFIVNKVN